MAEGGVALRPVRRWIGESGPEAVVPLHRMGELFGGRGGFSIQIGSIVGTPDPEEVGELAKMATMRALREDPRMQSRVAGVARRRLHRGG
jgi:hypothetical protein